MDQLVTSLGSFYYGLISLLAARVGQPMLSNGTGNKGTNEEISDIAG